MLRYECIMQAEADSFILMTSQIMALDCEASHDIYFCSFLQWKLSA